MYPTLESPSGQARICPQARFYHDSSFSRNRQRPPWVLRVIPIPFGSPLGTASIGYLTDLIYGRDMWMHRLDICRATGREMELTSERMTADEAMSMVSTRGDTELAKWFLARSDVP